MFELGEDIEGAGKCDQLKRSRPRLLQGGDEERETRKRRELIDARVGTRVGESTSRYCQLMIEWIRIDVAFTSLRSILHAVQQEYDPTQIIPTI